MKGAHAHTHTLSDRDSQKSIIQNNEDAYEGRSISGGVSVRICMHMWGVDAQECACICPSTNVRYNKLYNTLTYTNL